MKTFPACPRCGDRHRQATPKQERFAQAYVISLDAASAAREARYAGKHAAKQGYTLLSKPGVQCWVRYYKKSQVSRLQLDADLVLGQIQRIALLELGDLFDSNGELLPVQRWPREIQSVVAGLEIDASSDGTRTAKVKLPDRLKALELLGRHLKLFTDVHEHKVSNLHELMSRGRREAKRRKG